MAILVTGGAGYIGSHAVRALIGAGEEVVVADNLRTGFRAAVHPQARFYRLDLCDRSALSALFERERIDGVLHFAASSLVAESMRAPLAYYENNVGATASLVRCMVAHGVARLVFSSSASVYGAAEGALTEDAPLRPVNCYGETKRAAEALLHWAAEAHGLRYAALRYFNACGAHPSGELGEAHDPETHLIPLVLRTALGQRPALQLFGTDFPTRDGTAVRDYVHVEDLARAHLLALDYLAAGGESGAFNLGTGRGFSVREVLETARAVTGAPIPAEEAPRRAGDPASITASAEKAARLLGWEPRHPALEDMIASAWRFHRTHPHGYEG